MRVISGTAKGRPLKSVPGTGTRPTSDKVKEALFSIIGPYFDGGEVLDLFAGTGGLGIEALSRGISRAVFVDADKRSVETVRSNVRAANVEEQSQIFRSDANQALRLLAKQARSFDLVFLDPPYRMKNVPSLLEFMETNGILRVGATAVVEHEAAVDYPEQIGSFRLRRKAKYGDTTICIYIYQEKSEEESI